MWWVANEDFKYMVELLIAAGADVNIKDSEDNSPLHIQGSYASWKVLEFR
jgi:ankyrin repeat protein